MIGYFVYNLDSYSGAAQQALLLAKNINKKILIFNHNNKVFKKYTENNNIIIIDLPRNTLLQLSIIIFFTLKYKIKIYHFHGFFKFALGLGFISKRKMLLKTTLLDRDDFNSIEKSKYSKIKLFLISKVNKNIVLSQKLKEINSKYINVSKIELIPNGVYIDDNCLTVNEKENSFCFVGLVCQRKKTYDSIKYFIDNYSKDKTCKMYIVGPYDNFENNNELDKLYVEKCFSLVKEKNLEKNIIFTGRLSKHETQDILHKSKSLLFFSDKEGMPNVVLEAMSNNCVPITSELDGVMSEIFTDTKQGYILKDLATSISLNNIENLINSKMPYKKVNDFFGIKIIADRYRKIYESF